MIKTYLRYGFRYLLKSKGYTLINVAGLSIGLACCLGIGLFIYDELNFDHFHRNLSHIYRVVEKQKQAGVVYDVASTPGPLAPAMEKDLPEVVETCRLGTGSGFIELGDKVIQPPSMRYADNSFFSMFDFKLIVGNPATVLNRPDEIILNETTAIQLFGSGWRSKPGLLGTLVKLTSWGKEYLLSIAGVAEDAPRNSHIQYSVLMSMAALEKDTDFQWGNNSYQTYIQLEPLTDVASLNARLRTYIDRYSDYNSKDDARTLLLQPMKDIYLRSNFAFETNNAVQSSLIYTRIFLAVGMMVLLIAVFNFVNLTTARATHRAKDVGIRKVIGALYRQLVVQFLIESFMLTAIAVIFALAFLQLSMPLLNDISGKSLVIPFASPIFWLTVISSTLVISLLAGLYPAFYLSNFSPAKVLKGFSKNGSGLTFRQVLVVGQFSFSVILVIGSIVIYQQLQYVQDKDLGFDRSQLIHVFLRNKMHHQSLTFKEELKDQPGIAAVAPLSGMLVDFNNSTFNFKWEGQNANDELLMTQANTDSELMTTLGMELLAGRNFYPDENDSSSYLVNETAVKRMGWTNDQAIGKSITLWGKEGQVIGVVKDFHFRPMTVMIEPFVFRCWKKADYNGVLVKAQPGRVREAIAVIEQHYKKHDAKGTLDFVFMDDAIDAQYRTQQNTGNIILVFAVLAILVSCLGLFGLATYAAEQRTREIGIRKVLGASMASIIRLLSVDFVKLVLISIVLATPVAWYSLDRWLEDFAYRIDIQWWMLAAAGFILVAIALLTVSYHSIRTAVTSPVKSLRTD
ncbi:ABC transporter permease [Chryseolinea sp. T2]|uniref:ABC transporter permease n=1 Tax=Chryseolinea sp. T2 TaxID=3129255 RepID=UPI003077A678